MAASGPFVLSEEFPEELHDHGEELNLLRPMGGPIWWNSLLWTNFPPLAMFSNQGYMEGSNSEFFSSLSSLNSDKRLSEQYVTFTAARHDLCNSRPLPQKCWRLTVECMQYEGVRDCSWNFPLADYIPKRDNHNVPETQARRFWDNNVLHMGLNAEEFSEKVMPVGDIEAEIRIADYAGNPSWGYYPVVMRVAGWPFRIRKIGSFEGFGKGGHNELNIGLHWFEEQKLWNLLEGQGVLAATGSDNSMKLQGNQRQGYKFYAVLTDLDWLGPNISDKKYDDPEVPQEKGYVWFTVEETVSVPAGGLSAVGKAVRIKLLDEGVVPAWLDMHYLKVFAGGLPLGFLSEAEVDPEAEGADEKTVCEIAGGKSSCSKVQVLRTVANRRVVVENAASRLVFKDPLDAQSNDLVDMGWAIFDCCYRGATVRIGSHAGKWSEEPLGDRGLVDFKAAGPPHLCSGEGKDQIIIQAPKSDYLFERHLVR